MAHGAFDPVGGMRAGFPLVRYRLVAGGTGISGWNQPMEHMFGLILLSHGGLDGNGQNERAEQGETEHARTETIQGQTSGVRSSSIEPAMAAISDIHHLSQECDLRNGCEAFCQSNVIPALSLRKNLNNHRVSRTGHTRRPESTRRCQT
jgi:hypothetical protein